MRCGLYGKLPSKRDFVALYAPRAFLEVWEPWIQSSVAASKQTLGRDWQQTFLTAPIWRFWLGAGLCGAPVSGAFMPSLDGVGRYFPLTLFACADEQAIIPPPELNAQDEWFATVEDFLLGTLDQDAAFEATSAALDALGAPSDRLDEAAGGAPILRARNAVAAAAGDRPFPEMFAAMRKADHTDVYAAATFWWTIGGEGFPPFLIGCKGMPDPFLFADMLAGRLATESMFAPTV
ncbi:MAG: type VI secretion system-associated protein TagF [Rhizobiales bacterium]|nr:type VI secretion system-associated protein TagF [Hyphomicrobiales bacterium]